MDQTSCQVFTMGGLSRTRADDSMANVAILQPGILLPGDPSL